MLLVSLQKKSQEGINTRLALVMKSGKFTLGTKTCLKCLRSGKGGLHKLMSREQFCSEIQPSWEEAASSSFPISSSTSS